MISIWTESHSQTLRMGLHTHHKVLLTTKEYEHTHNNDNIPKCNEDSEISQVV